MTKPGADLNTVRVPFPRETGDAEGLLDLADDLLAATVAMYAPESIYLVRIDNWFDWKWRGFQGKTLGALGISNRLRLVIPPFHPHRVRCQQRLRCSNDGRSYESAGEGRPLHIEIPSQANFRRWVRDLAPATVLAWLGGDSEASGRGSVMIYAGKPLPEFPQGAWSSWYVSFRRDGDKWRWDRADGLSRAEIAAMLERGAATRHQ